MDIFKNSLDKMSLVDHWNMALMDTWPFSDIFKGLGVECLPSGVSLFTLDNLKEIRPFFQINWRKVASTLSITEIYANVPIPDTPDKFVDYILNYIRIIETSNKTTIEENAQGFYSLSVDPRKRIPVEGVVGLLDQIFTCTFKSEECIGRWYDIDLSINVDDDDIRKHKSILLGIVSNDTFNFHRHFIINTPILSSDECLLVDILEKTRRGTMYANLDQKTRIRKITQKYIDPAHRIASDSLDLFNFVSTFIHKFRDPSKVASSVSTTVEEGTSTPKGKKRKALPQKVRMTIWRRAFSTWDGVCYCCGDNIQYENFDVGHIIASVKGGADTIDNLRPVCRSCNLSMGTRHMDEFITSHGYPGPPKDKKEKRKRKKKVRRSKKNVHKESK